MTYDSTCISKFRTPEHGRCHGFPPSHKTLDTQLMGINKIQHSKAWRHGVRHHGVWHGTSGNFYIHSSHVVPRDKNLFVTKAFLCVIHRNYFFISILKPKCWVDDNPQMYTKHQEWVDFFPRSEREILWFLGEPRKGAEHWNLYCAEW